VLEAGMAATANDEMQVATLPALNRVHWIAVALPRFRPHPVLAFIPVLVLSIVCLAAEGSTPINFRPNDPQNQIAFERLYNLDYDAAVQDFEKVLGRHPNDPNAVNHLLSAVLVRELYRVGAMNTGEYANDSFVGQVHRPPDPAVKERIKQLAQQAEKLEENALSKNKNDIDALYARGVTRAQFAAYTGLIERAWLSALRNAVGARHDHEKVLELDPTREDAKLVVGTHNYIMGNLPLAVKVAVALVGLSGDKEKGLKYLSEDAHSNSETSVDAAVLLMLFLRRERRYGDALEMARSISPRYPRNYLIALEEANLMRAMGKNSEAEEQYRRVWQSGREGKYGNLHYEVAAIGLGDLLRAERNFQAAAHAYEQVADLASPEPEILQKANLGAGEMYDLMQKRDLAMKRYQAVVATNGENSEAERARRRMKDAYRE
jgi:tetratricopeptide (TPR) repeat protein